MSWGQWLVPELSLAADLECRSKVLALQESGPNCPEAVLTVAVELTKAWYRQDSIIRKAIERVNELEMQLEFGKPAESSYAAWAADLLNQAGNRDS